ncbi:copper resistance protein NlpE [Methylocaldum szegediense]|uniref:copper resistance protein NlpE n=1 Tax=Methylocaldum szegediense TaxID=73780 RepID=UPI00295E98CE|nr:copper resistance protein NlpE [Methylocaldum szegediense]
MPARLIGCPGLGLDESFVMNVSNRKAIKKALVIVFGVLLSWFSAAWAESDKEIQEKALRAREQNKHGAMDHSGHASPDATAGAFRGVFYGYLPCSEEKCAGLKMTLSLNAKNKYLLVTQPAKPQNRESFEKGKYEWDDSKGILVLTPNNDAPQRRLAIKDEATLLYLSSDGTPMPGDQDRYLLQRSDKAGNREMHIH